MGQKGVGNSGDKLAKRHRDFLALFSPISERYVNSRLEIIAYLHLSHADKWYDFQAIFDRPDYLTNLGDKAGFIPMHIGTDGAYGGNGEQEFVFVSDVEFIERNEVRYLPSRVRLQRANDVDGLFGGQMYKSIREGGFKTRPFRAERELDLIHLGRFRRLDQVIDDVIQGGAQIVDRVSDDWREILGSVFFDFEDQGYGFCVRVSLEGEVIRVACNKVPNGTIELVDVAFGPFNLN